MARDIMGEESWERNHGQRNHGRSPRRGIMGRGIMGNQPWEGSHGKRLSRSSQDAPRGSQEAPKTLPEGSQEAARATKAPRGV